MAQRESPPVDDEEGEHIPNLDIRLPDLIADGMDQNPDVFDYPVGKNAIPDLEDQDLMEELEAARRSRVETNQKQSLDPKDVVDDSAESRHSHLCQSYHR